MYDKKYNHCRFWFMSAELKSLLLSGRSINTSAGYSKSYCNLYESTGGIEVVQMLYEGDDDKFGKEVLRVCQHFTPLSYWYYTNFYAVPARLRWGNVITRSWLPNLICRLRGWNRVIKNGRCVRGVPDCWGCKKHCSEVKK